MYNMPAVFPLLVEMTDNTDTFVRHTSNPSVSDFVASLKLEAVMGEMAMINGKVVQIGDTVGFSSTKNPLRLEEVQGRTVILSAGNHRYELSIAPHRR